MYSSIRTVLLRPARPLGEDVLDAGADARATCVDADDEYHGLKAAPLAKAADVSPAYLSEIERGAKPGSVAALKALTGALGVSMDDLA